MWRPLAFEPFSPFFLFMDAMRELLLCPRALITRPEPEASRWVQALAVRGVPAHVLPLITIAAAPVTGELEAKLGRLHQYAALMFVSGNAAQHFFGVCAQMPNFSLPARAQAWAPGPGTSAVLRAQGWPPERIVQPPLDARQFDSEALWECVQGQVQSGQRVLIVRGGEGPASAASGGQGRSWLTQQLQARGLTVDHVAVYWRRAPVFASEQKALARQAAGDGTGWVFSSSESVDNLLAAMPGQSWAQARAIATHPRIAQTLQEAGFGTVRESRPVLKSVAQTLQEWDKVRARA